jgi:hypothetical protein
VQILYFTCSCLIGVAQYIHVELVNFEIDKHMSQVGS